MPASTRPGMTAWVMFAAAPPGAGRCRESGALVNRRNLLTTVPAAAVVGVLGPRALDVSAQKALKVAFVYVGPIGDMGWTYAHDQGRLDLAKAFPNVETS